MLALPEIHMIYSILAANSIKTAKNSDFCEIARFERYFTRIGHNFLKIDHI